MSNANVLYGWPFQAVLTSYNTIVAGIKLLLWHELMDRVQIDHLQHSVESKKITPHCEPCSSLLQAGDWPMSLSEEELEAVAAAAQEGDMDAALTLGKATGSATDVASYIVAMTLCTCIVQTEMCLLVRVTAFMRPVAAGCSNSDLRCRLF